MLSVFRNTKNLHAHLEQINPEDVRLKHTHLVICPEKPKLSENDFISVILL